MAPWDRHGCPVVVKVTWPVGGRNRGGTVTEVLRRRSARHRSRDSATFLHDKTHPGSARHGSSDSVRSRWWLTLGARKIRRVVRSPRRPPRPTRTGLAEPASADPPASASEASPSDCRTVGPPVPHQQPPGRCHQPARPIPTRPNLPRPVLPQLDPGESDPSEPDSSTPAPSDPASLRTRARLLLLRAPRQGARSLPHRLVRRFPQAAGGAHGPRRAHRDQQLRHRHQGRDGVREPPHRRCRSRGPSAPPGRSGSRACRICSPVWRRRASTPSRGS